ncbi:MAG: chemotaxis-specific protein-glutamate methyltransferase CheB [Myxococcota bacterium]|jgi:two-component system chemotaxis response regulator CheB|nr:chemotaxis-specific protein-glutamate methyltransferase CheB [Myxococcota bacterium]
MIRVMIADDSKATQRLLMSLLDSEPGIEVVGTASNGNEAIEMYRRLRPDLVTMDIYMPELDGLEATRSIMNEFPEARIVIISSLVNSKDLKTSFEAMRAGAVEVVGKPTGVLRGDYTEVKVALSRILRRMMESHPARRLSWQAESPRRAEKKTEEKGSEISGRFRIPSSIPPSDVAAAESMPALSEVAPPTAAVQELKSSLRVDRLPEKYCPSLVVIGGSTGAPAVLVDLISALPADYPLPIVIAQHIARGFAKGLADWLSSSSRIKARLADDGDSLRPGTVLVSRDDSHLVIKPGGTVGLVERIAHEQYTPSINVFFESTAEAYGPRALGILLTGMGADGAAGLLKMRDNGAVTLAQDESSAVVYGMPRVAYEIGAVFKQMNPIEMVAFLLSIQQRFQRPEA